MKDFAISDERFSQIGGIFERVLKIAVIASSFLCLAGFLGMIFVTLSPTPPSISLKRLSVPGKPTNSSLTPMTDGRNMWITVFTAIEDEPGKCVESSTGFIVTCNPPSEGGKWDRDGTIVVSDGVRYFTWQCKSCLSCFWCLGRGNDCDATNKTDVPLECVCKACDCDITTKKSFCVEVPSTNAPSRDLDPKFQTFAIITDLVYLVCILMILLAELDIVQFLERATLLTYWPVRALLQIFVSVQMINNSSALEISGNHESSAHILSLLGGWIMFSSGLVHVVFYGVFARKWKVTKYCAMFCFLIILVIVPVGISLGTTAEEDSSA